MPRKQTPQPPSRTLYVVVGLAVALYVLSRPGVVETLGALIVVSGIGCAGVFVWKRKQHQDEVQRAFQFGQAVIDQNVEALTRRRAQLVRSDAYGRPILDRWNKEIESFITDHIAAKLGPMGRAVLESLRPPLANLIVRRTFERLQQGPVFNQFSDDMTPSDFELFCAEQLQRAGWNAQVTMRSRDQGVDVVAEKGGTRVVLQCKLYSGPVGNGAVQEIAAGRTHERANYGAVVTNNRYTGPAEQLAATNGILLLHYRDLIRLDELLPARHLH